MTAASSTTQRLPPVLHGAGRMMQPLIALAIVCQPSISWAQATNAPDESALRVARIIADLPPQIVTQESRPRPLTTAMREANVPSVSVAVFIDGNLAWARAWGQADPVSKRAATPDTLYQAASISKPVAALAAMRLVERGKLALDADVSHAVDGWQVDAPITLRQLLSHSAGLSVSGFAGYAAGTAVPSPIQILQGIAPANSQPVAITIPPNTAFRYSGGGYTVAQMLVAQASGTPFETALGELVLTPLGMTNSMFAQPLPADARLRAAVAHSNGTAVKGGANVYPELAAAGLWTTPSEVGHIAVDVQNAHRGLASIVTTPETAKAMLTRQTGGYGIGFDLNTLNGFEVFEHSGLNKGFEARLVASADATGPRFVVVVMTNGQGGTAVADGMIRAVAREYSWGAFAPTNVKKIAVRPDTLARFIGLYRGSNRTIGIELHDGDLYVRDSAWRRGRMIPVGDGRFVVENRNGAYAFLTSPDGAPLSLTIDQPSSSLTLTKSPGLSALTDANPLYLMGAANGQKSEARLMPGASGGFHADVPLQPGRYAFRIGDRDLAQISLGASLQGSQISLGQTMPMADNGDSLTVSVDAPGIYRFILQPDQYSRYALRVTLATKLQSTRP